jgi:hypothetical protein
VLATLGFREVQPPDGWIAPARLFECQDRWFGASWDWRDLYLEIALGRLFRFRDVLPRVIVRGPYCHNVDCKDQDVERFLTVQLTSVGQALPSALEQFDAQLSAALQADRIPPKDATKQGRRVFAEYAIRIGDPLTLEEWKGSRVV